MTSSHLDLVRKRFEDDRYARHLGIELEALTDATVRMRMRVREDMLNWFGRLHGGVIYSFADAAFSVLTNNDDNLSVALDCAITYHASPELGQTLVAEGETLARTRKTAAFLFSVFMEKEDGRVRVATMKSLSYRTGKPIGPAPGPP